MCVLPRLLQNPLDTTTGVLGGRQKKEETTAPGSARDPPRPGGNNGRHHREGRLRHGVLGRLQRSQRGSEGHACRKRESFYIEGSFQLSRGGVKIGYKRRRVLENAAPQRFGFSILPV